jgi:hypothetical protein
MILNWHIVSHPSQVDSKAVPRHGSTAMNKRALLPKILEIKVMFYFQTGRVPTISCTYTFRQYILPLPSFRSRTLGRHTNRSGSQSRWRASAGHGYPCCVSSCTPQRLYRGGLRPMLLFPSHPRVSGQVSIYRTTTRSESGMYIVSIHRLPLSDRICHWVLL